MKYKRHGFREGYAHYGMQNCHGDVVYRENLRNAKNIIVPMIDIVRRKTTEKDVEFGDGHGCHLGNCNSWGIGVG